VIYDEVEKHKAIEQAVNAIVDSTVKNCSIGIADSPWMQFTIESHAGIAAQCLMDIVVSLKADKYREDNEWRIVCSLDVLVASSAPDSEDNAFSYLIRTRADGKKYVALSIREPAERDTNQWDEIVSCSSSIVRYGLGSPVTPFRDLCSR
jgi:hypothetical protein